MLDVSSLLKRNILKVLFFIW